jgi:hypothetical protein
VQESTLITWSYEDELEIKGGKLGFHCGNGCWSQLPTDKFMASRIVPPIPN